MPLDPSISLQTKPVVLPNPVEQYGNALQLQSAQQSLATNALAYGQAQRSADETNALRTRIAAPDFSGLTPQQQIGEIQKVAPIAGQPIVDKMLTNRKTMVETDNAAQTGAQSGRDAALKAIASAKTPTDMIQAGLDGVRNGAWTLQAIGPQLGHLTDGTVTADNFSQYRDAILKQTLSGQSQYDATQPDLIPVESNGGTVLVNKKASAGPVGVPVAPVIPGNPSLTTDANGGVLGVNPDKRTVFTPTVVAPGMPSPATPGGAGAYGGGPSPANAVYIDPAQVGVGPNAAPPRTPQTQAAMDAINAQATGKAPTVGTSAGNFPTTVPSALVQASQRNPLIKDYSAPEDAKRASTYEEKLNSDVTSGRDLMQLNGAMQDALKNYQAGPGAETRLQLAKAMAAVGFRPSLVAEVNRGDISAAQTIQKLGVIGTLDSLKAALAGQGTPNRAEYQNFSAANPGINIDPAASERIQSFQADQYSRHYAEQQALADFKRQGGDSAQWPAVWAKLLDTQGLSQPARATDAKGTPGSAFAPPSTRTVVRTGNLNGQKVVQYSDGTFGYAQ